MVVGNGLLAKAFINFSENENITIFASGVSNSSETDENLFLREENLLRESISLKKHLTYFSSCDTIYAEKIKKPYYFHKLKMEQIIAAECEHYHIFRIPQIIASSGNKLSLISYFIDKIKSNEPFEIWGNAWKNLINVNDVSTMISYILNHELVPNSIQNIGNRNYYSLTEIIKSIEDLLCLKGNYQILEKGFKPDYNLEFSNRISSEVNIHFHENYLHDSLKNIIQE